eukprot:Gb_26088 [translate_table: standard]
MSWRDSHIDFPLPENGKSEGNLRLQRHSIEYHPNYPPFHIPCLLSSIAKGATEEEQREKSEARFVMSTYSRSSRPPCFSRWIGQRDARHLSRPCCPNDKVEPAAGPILLRTLIAIPPSDEAWSTHEGFLMFGENYGDIPLLVLDPAPAALDILLYPGLRVEDPKRSSLQPFTGNNGEEGVHVAVAPILSSRFGIYYERIHLKPPQPSTHSSVGHVGSIRTGFSCGTVEGIQSLLIGISIHISMTIDGFAIVPTLQQTRVRYIADLVAPAGTNPISAITSSITMFPYARIPPLAGLCSNFHSFSTASGCGAYSPSLMGVVTNAIGRWAAERLPEVSSCGGPKAVLRAPNT